jgi:hypothetical protein
VKTVTLCEEARAFLRGPGEQVLGGADVAGGAHRAIKGEGTLQLHIRLSSAVLLDKLGTGQDSSLGQAALQREVIRSISDAG